ncbi:DUF1963 domain-containing protein [Flavobacterium collinsii]|uniref:DUF1963 domain-containing protein n=1 Tax=Flavobacterium collinsii TaxID=1114861 RepID=A0ABM8KIN6_9FLAO|nr:DUF1963 domain-containing protein [Flavobacterium collinsii]CAA9198636.1 hypothetical protein FLACOL7796_02247 [Flavobacterium collinsii]
MDEVQRIKKQLAKTATEFISGGFRPTNSASESWIGRVYLYKEAEGIPLDDNNELMWPLFQLCLEGLPFVPEILKSTKTISVFISKNIPMDLTPNGNNWTLREYGIDDTLIIKDLKNPVSHLKAFPLSNKLIEEDYPVWEDCSSIPEDVTDKILELEESKTIDNYYDIVENNYSHKIGGYPSYCQSGIDFGNDFEFVIQISSDEKVNLNIVDNGNIYLAKNSKTGQWVYYCDFY